MRVFKAVSWILMALVLGSCALMFDQASYSYEEGGISSLTAPLHAKVGDSVRIDVGTVGWNGCHQLDAVKAEVDPAKREVVVRAVNRVRAGVCTMAIVQGQGSVDFTPTATGTYLIKASNFSPHGPKGASASATVSIEVVAAD